MTEDQNGSKMKKILLSLDRFEEEELIDRTW